MILNAPVPTMLGERETALSIKTTSLEYMYRFPATRGSVPTPTKTKEQPKQRQKLLVAPASKRDS